jgi:hypothetical protein
MSASRTLLRRRKDADQRTIVSDDGERETVTYRRIKPGHARRRIIRVWEAGGREYRHHATKGIRIGRP